MSPREGHNDNKYMLNPKHQPTTLARSLIHMKVINFLGKEKTNFVFRKIYNVLILSLVRVFTSSYGTFVELSSTFNFFSYEIVTFLYLIKFCCSCFEFCSSHLSILVILFVINQNSNQQLTLKTNFLNKYMCQLLGMFCVLSFI